MDWTDRIRRNLPLRWVFAVLASLAWVAGQFGARTLYTRRYRQFRKDLRSALAQYETQLKGCIPEVLIETLVAAEDRRFHLHRGIDPFAILRAMYLTVRTRKLQGGSTIHQQLVRAITGRRERRLSRKLSELLLACTVESIIPKSDIPGLYLSLAYLGWGMSGLEQATRRLGIGLDTMSVAEASQVVARLKYPQPRAPTTDYWTRVARRAEYIRSIMASHYPKVARPVPKQPPVLTVSNPAKLLVGSYPPPDTIAPVLYALGPNERRGVIHLWLSEGIPYVFRDVPIAYEIVREWLAHHFEVHPKDIVLVGSARLGYSLASNPHFGKQFDEASDIDLAVVSRPLFKRVACEFMGWRRDYLAGRVRPRNRGERRYWPDNARDVPANIASGFIDLKYIPPRDLYPLSQRLHDTLYRLQVSAFTRQLIGQHRFSLRIYESWAAFTVQMQRNLEKALSSLGFVGQVIGAQDTQLIFYDTNRGAVLVSRGLSQTEIPSRVSPSGAFVAFSMGRGLGHDATLCVYNVRRRKLKQMAVPPEKGTRVLSLDWVTDRTLAVLVDSGRDNSHSAIWLCDVVPQTWRLLVEDTADLHIVGMTATPGEPILQVETVQGEERHRRVFALDLDYVRMAAPAEQGDLLDG